MPDISMCANFNCPLRKNCYRYRAIPSDGYQAYADFTPNGKECDGFWSAKGRACEPVDVAEERNKKLYNLWNKRSEK